MNESAGLTSSSNPAALASSKSGEVVSPLTQSRDILDALNAAVGGRQSSAPKMSAQEERERRYAKYISRSEAARKTPPLPLQQTSAGSGRIANEIALRRTPPSGAKSDATASLHNNSSSNARGTSAAVTFKTPTQTSKGQRVRAENAHVKDESTRDPCVLTYHSPIVLRSSQGTCMRASKVTLDATGSASEEGCAVVPVNVNRRSDDGPVRSRDVVALSCLGSAGRFLGVWSRSGPYMEGIAFEDHDDPDADSEYAIMARRKQFGRNEKWTIVRAADTEAALQSLPDTGALQEPLRSSEPIVLRSELVPRLFLAAHVVYSGEGARLVLVEMRGSAIATAARWSMVKRPAPYVPEWSRSRTYLTGERMMVGRSGADIAANARSQQGTDAKRLSLSEQETILVDDMLYAMQGVSGSSIAFCSSDAPWKSALSKNGGNGALWDIGIDVDTGKVFVDSDAGSRGVADPSLLHLARRIFPLCIHYVRVTAFIERRSKHEHGKVSHALAAACRKLMCEYDVLVAQLEDEHRAGSLTMQKLWFYVQPSMRTLEILDLVASECAWQRGGHLLNQLRSITRRGGDAKTRAVFAFLVERAVVPYLEMLELWIYHGQCHDPYQEFVVKIDAETEKQMLGEDFNATYWDKKYTIRESSSGVAGMGDYAGIAGEGAAAAVQTPARPRGATGAAPPARASALERQSSNDVSKYTDNDNVPFFLKKVARKVLTTGKYLNVARECGKWVAAPFARRVTYTPAEAENNFDGMITEAYRWASESLLKLLLDENQLLARLRSIKHYFLMDQGDFFVHFMDVAGSKLLQRAEDIALPRLQSILEMCLRNRYANDPYQDDLTCELVPYTLIQHVEAIHETASGGNRPNSPVIGILSPGMSLIDASAAPSSLNGTDAFTLDINVKYLSLLYYRDSRLPSISSSFVICFSASTSSGSCAPRGLATKRRRSSI